MNGIGLIGLNDFTHLFKTAQSQFDFRIIRPGYGFELTILHDLEFVPEFFALFYGAFHRGDDAIDLRFPGVGRKQNSQGRMTLFNTILNLIGGIFEPDHPLLGLRKGKNASRSFRTCEINMMAYR